jgi:hypothetical protein
LASSSIAVIGLHCKSKKEQGGGGAITTYLSFHCVDNLAVYVSRRVAHWCLNHLAMKAQFSYMKPENGRANNGDNSFPGIQLSQTGTTADNTTPAVLRPDETILVDAKEVKLVEVKKTSVQTMLLRAGAVFIGKVLDYTMSSCL